MSLTEKLEQARRATNGRDRDWVFFWVMDAKDRKNFDAMLVRTKDPLAYEPGTTESRFREYVTRDDGFLDIYSAFA